MFSNISCSSTFNFDVSFVLMRSTTFKDDLFSSNIKCLEFNGSNIFRLSSCSHSLMSALSVSFLKFLIAYFADICVQHNMTKSLYRSDALCDFFSLNVYNWSIHCFLSSCFIASISATILKKLLLQ